MHVVQLHGFPQTRATVCWKHASPQFGVFLQLKNCNKVAISQNTDHELPGSSKFKNKISVSVQLQTARSKNSLSFLSPRKRIHSADLAFIAIQLFLYFVQRDKTQSLSRHYTEMGGLRPSIFRKVSFRVFFYFKAEMDF